MHEPRRIAILGDWSAVPPKLEKEIRQLAERVMREGNILVTGGMIGADFLAADEALIFDSWAERISIVLPTDIDAYEAYIHQLSSRGKLTQAQATLLIGQLRSIYLANPDAVVTIKTSSLPPIPSLKGLVDAVIARSDEIYLFTAAADPDFLQRAKKNHVSVHVHRLPGRKS